MDRFAIVLRLAVLPLAAAWMAGAEAGVALAGDALALAKVSECRLAPGGVGPSSVIFYGRMRAVPGTHRMAVRFSVRQRLGDGSEAWVAAPGLDIWRGSRPRVDAFGYRQTVAGLHPGDAYRALVSFRWRDAEGRVIRSAVRTTRDCAGRAAPAADPAPAEGTAG